MKFTCSIPSNNAREVPNVADPSISLTIKLGDKKE
jgi:hypothetical protein